jgi:hypothetical protein
MPLLSKSRTRKAVAQARINLILGPTGLLPALTSYAATQDRPAHRLQASSESLKTGKVNYPQIPE